MQFSCKILFYSLAPIAHFISAFDIEYENNQDLRDLINDDGKITNEDSNADVLSINPLQMTLSPTPDILPSDAIAKIKTILEETVLENLNEMGSSFSTITSVTFNEITNVKWVEGKPMTRHGRFLADGSFSEPHTILDIPGGTANSTFSIFYSTPSEQELNNAILSILVTKASAAFSNNGLDYESETAVLPDERGEPVDVSEKSKSNAASVAVGVVVAFIVVIGASLYARRNGTVGKLQQKYDILKSNLRARKDQPVDDADFLVEVCSDNMEKGPLGGPSSPGSVKSHRSVLSILSGNRSPLSAMDGNATVEPTSPQSVKSNKSFLSISSLRSRKNDVESFTEDIEDSGPSSPLSTQSKTSTRSQAFSDGRQSPSSIRAREKEPQQVFSPQDFTIEINQD